MRKTAPQSWEVWRTSETARRPWSTSGACSGVLDTAGHSAVWSALAHAGKPNHRRTGPDVPARAERAGRVRAAGSLESALASATRCRRARSQHEHPTAGRDAWRNHRAEAWFYRHLVDHSHQDWAAEGGTSVGLGGLEAIPGRRRRGHRTATRARARHEARTGRAAQRPVRLFPPATRLVAATRALR